MNYLKSICSNDYILSLCISSVIIAIIYVENKLSKKVSPISYYIKLFVIIIIGIYTSLYLKNMNFESIKKTKNVNVNIGEPTF